MLTVKSLMQLAKRFEKVKLTKRQAIINLKSHGFIYIPETDSLKSFCGWSESFEDVCGLSNCIKVVSTQKLH